ncbi:MAG: hypothetical protein ACPG5T_11030, partial [Endozoicomonas sp.]
MIPQKQLNRHDPDNGVYGDCDRTCIACILDLNVENVPHFMDGVVSTNQKEAFSKRTNWLANKGLRETQEMISGSHSIDEVLDIQGKYNPGIYYRLFGTSGSGVNHFVVC